MSNKANQMAVDWLVNEVNKDCHISAYFPPHLIIKAKSMEKEQIINAWDKAYVVGGANGSNDWVNECELTDNGEYYYNETYNK